VYEILRDRGLNIPGDVSVAGFDNIEKGEWVIPSLTTINIQKSQMGERAVELLLKRIEDPDRCIELVMIGTDIVKRDSVRVLEALE
jgi:LacI family transcriptional regulator